jgi:hypothetical protein
MAVGATDLYCDKEQRALSVLYALWASACDIVFGGVQRIIVWIPSTDNEVQSKQRIKPRLFPSVRGHRSGEYRRGDRGHTMDAKCAALKLLHAYSMTKSRAKP